MIPDSNAMSPLAITNATDRVNLELLSFAPHGAGIALALNCGNGSIAARRRLWRPDAAIFGQEADGPAAALATAVLDGVHCDLADSLAPLALTGDRPAEVVTFAGGLETVSDPAGLLRTLATGMAPGATLALAFSPSNGAEALAALIAGRLDLAEAHLGGGLRRHLTIERVMDYARAANLHEAGLKPLAANAAEAQRLARGLAQLVTNGPQIDAIAARLMASRWLIRFTLTPARRIWLQSMTLRPVGGVNAVRIDQPLGFLAGEPGVSTRIEERGASFSGVPDQPRIFIWQRPILTRASHLAPIKQIRDHGYVQICEFDDHPLVWPAIAENDYLNYRGVHAVQTSTPVLVELFKQWNPEVGLFENTMAEVPPPRAPRQADQPITIFFGALNRDKDWAPILPILNATLAKAKRPVRVEIVHDKKLFDAISHKNKGFTPTCPYPEYLALLGRSDIALLPLEPGLFNGMKSNLKYLECAASGAVALASPTVYDASITDGENGVLFKTPEEFGRKLAELIIDDDRRQTIAEAARAWLLDGRLLWQQSARRLAWYQDLWDRRPALDAALVQRVPEVG